MEDSKRMNLTVEKLFSGKVEEVLFTIKQLRNSGDAKILPHIIELLSKKTNEEVDKAIIGLLNDLKNQSGTSMIIAALQNDKYKSIHKQLLASCWQSGLKYSTYLDFFIDLFLYENFEIAFETFTIIENMEEKLEHQIIDPLIIKLKLGISKIEGEKTELLLELVRLLQNMKI